MDSEKTYICILLLLQHLKVETKNGMHIIHQGLKNPLVWDLRFVGSDLTFSNSVKTDGPVETVQLWT